MASAYAFLFPNEKYADSNNIFTSSHLKITDYLEIIVHHKNPEYTTLLQSK